jgi:hypothetical protein
MTKILLKIRAPLDIMPCDLVYEIKGSDEATAPIFLLWECYISYWRFVCSRVSNIYPAFPCVWLPYYASSFLCQALCHWCKVIVSQGSVTIAQVMILHYSCGQGLRKVWPKLGRYAQICSYFIRFTPPLSSETKRWLLDPDACGRV